MNRNPIFDRIVVRLKTRLPFVFDDGGRKASGRDGKAGDCVTRAIAIASGRPYEEVWQAIASIMAEMPKTRKRRVAGQRSANNGVYVTSVLFKRYMEGLGFEWTPTMTIGSGCRVHLRAGELPTGKLVVSVSKHYCAVIDGTLRDTGDCTRNGERCVYGYWKLRETPVA